MIKFQFFKLRAVNHNRLLYSSINLTRSHLFCLYVIEKNNWGGGPTERDLREVIGN